jgi:hypothetical protein
MDNVAAPPARWAPAPPGVSPTDAGVRGAVGSQRVQATAA